MEGERLWAQRHWQEAKTATGPVGPKPPLPRGGPVCGLEEAFPLSRPSPATPPAPGLMASRCWAPRRGHRPHPKPQPWLLPEGPSQGDLVQTWAKRAHTPGSREVGKRTTGSLIPSMETLGSKRCPSPHAHPQAERSLPRNPGEHVCKQLETAKASPGPLTHSVGPTPGLQDTGLALTPSWALASSPDREVVHVSLGWGSTDKPSPLPAPPRPAWAPSLRMQFPHGALEC